MNISHDIWLILLSLTASSFAMYITLGFIDCIYRTTSHYRNILLGVHSFAIGSGLWAVLFINLLIFHVNPLLTIFSIDMLAAWLVALIIGLTLCFVASKKTITLSHLILGGAVIGISSYAMFYFALAGLNEINHIPTTVALITFEPLSLLGAISVAFIASTISLVIITWIKNYSGENKSIIKLIFSIITALAILAIHAIFNASIQLKTTQATQAFASEFADKTMVALVITLGLACLFLLTFIIALYYERFGVLNSFKINLLEKRNANFRDPLTQLPNRHAFHRELETAIKRRARGSNTIALAFIDLDHFKPINDNFGHHVGDAVLLAVAQRLNTAVRACDSIARIGGDEFMALIEEIKSDEDIIPIVERIVQSIKEPFLIQGQQIDISCSVGIAVYPRDGDIEKLMICADAAMYKAKESGKNQFRFFDSEIESASDQMLEMQRDLRLALKNDEFSLAFQPKVNCKTQSPVGAEALIRWNHPTKGIIFPANFIPAAERFGLINQINDWVVVESCRVIYRARKAGINLNLSVNLARQQFRNPNLVEDILKLRKSYKIPANNLMFEIKETTAIRSEDQFKQLLSQFKAADIKVALDDFGSHQFSLSYLQHLNIDEIKLDKVFVGQINESKNSHALVDAVIRLAHALDLNVVAEGVETKAQHDALVNLNCDHMQGYLFSVPLSEEKLLKLFKQLNTNFESTGQFSVSDYQTESA